MADGYCTPKRGSAVAMTTPSITFVQWQITAQLEPASTSRWGAKHQTWLAGILASLKSGAFGLAGGGKAFAVVSVVQFLRYRSRVMLGAHFSLGANLACLPSLGAAEGGEAISAQRVRLLRALRALAMTDNLPQNWNAPQHLLCRCKCARCDQEPPSGTGSRPCQAACPLPLTQGSGNLDLTRAPAASFTPRPGQPS